MAWSHCSLPAIELKGGSGAVPSLKKPAGVRVWAEDIHAERYPFEFLERGAPGGWKLQLAPPRAAVRFAWSVRQLSFASP